MMQNYYVIKKIFHHRGRYVNECEAYREHKKDLAKGFHLFQCISVVQFFGEQL